MEKKQYMPQEIEVWYILPAIRRELVKEMMKLGLKQKDIAKKLSITGAAVSQYKKQKRAKEVEFEEETSQEIKKAAKSIIDNPDNFISEMQRILAFVKKNRTLCKIHYSHGKMPEKCVACLGNGEVK